MSDGKTPTNEEMRAIRQIRESTCIHECYYADTPNECDPPEENGIPNCKREIELILSRAESSQIKGTWKKEVDKELEDLAIELSMNMAESESHGRDPQHLRGEISGVQQARSRLADRLTSSASRGGQKE